MAVQGTPRNVFDQFNFLVEIDGFVSAGFESCEGLEVSVGVQSYREGGELVADPSPGLAEFGHITLRRGTTTDNDLFNWFADVLDAAANRGKPVPGYERNLDILQLDRDKTVVKRWPIQRAWPMRFKPGNWKAEEGKSMEEVELVYKLFEPPASQ